MEKYISLLLFVIPGFLARVLISKFDNKDEIKSELEKTLIALLYSLPIWVISILILKCFKNINSIEELKNSFLNINFILQYTAITIGSTIIFVIIALVYILKIEYKLTNRIRKIIKLPMIAEHNNGWKEFFKGGSGRVIGIYKGAEERAKGILKNNSMNNDKRSEIILEEADLISEMSEYYKKVENIYIDLEKDIIIKEFKFEEKEEKDTDE
ncbi:hypothetical protein G6Z16_11575 [Clostridium perfringens]|uniref:hypothetical protein n=1 Tax=Clostridium perfringens TaxID=1502 RepID=UPI0013E33B54|nr:hypothetical protein [Clostridium perfringens]NGT67516.1 hypothetical protein [Clostridium perfringens]